MNDADNFDWMTQDEAQCLPDHSGVFNIYRDRFWLVDKDGRIAFFNYGKKRRKPFTGPAQCNQNETIVRSRVDREEIWVDVVWLDTVYAPIDFNDYDH